MKKAWDFLKNKTIKMDVCLLVQLAMTINIHEQKQKKTTNKSDCVYISGRLYDCRIYIVSIIVLQLLYKANGELFLLFFNICVMSFTA